MLNANQFNNTLLSRWDFLRAAFASGVALVTEGIVPILSSVESVLAQSTYYYGTDTSWVSDPKLPQNFYIGRTGVGELLYENGGFNLGAADKAGKFYTHTYWVLKGPYYKYRGSRTPYNYGKAQAKKACDALYRHKWKDKIGGKTIFADIENCITDCANEEKHDGWSSLKDGVINKPNNRKVLEGFVDGVKNYIDGGINPNLVPGVYTRADLWQSWFGTDYDPARTFVVWLAGCGACKACSPCSSCTTTKSEAAKKFDTVKETTLGKNRTVIWQYFVKECPGACGDYDIASQKGYVRFTPVTSTTVWKINC